jgi:hypothetical protein
MLSGFTIGSIFMTFGFWITWLVMLTNHRYNHLAGKVLAATFGYTAFTLALISVCVYFMNHGILY